MPAQDVHAQAKMSENVDQGLAQRILRYGTVTVYSSDETAPQIELPCIGNPVDVKETLRTQYRVARASAGVRPAELMMDP